MKEPPRLQYQSTLPRSLPAVRRMSSIPGTAGMPLVGDKSVEFYRDVIGFADRRIAQHKSRIFLSRLLNKPTVFVASNSAVKQLLNEHAQCLELGYKAFMHQIYGDNILFSDGSEAEITREALKSLLGDHGSITYFQDIVNKQTNKILDGIESGSPLAVYETLKQLATEICLSLFLGVNFEGSAQLAAQIVALTTTHWHGIISVPVSLSVPGLSRSTYSKALDAKGKLLEIIKQKLQETSSSAFPQKVKARGFPDSNEAANHLLLFTSALVPKAIASLLTSFILATCQEDHLQRDLLLDTDLLECTLLEVQRLSPPLVGGRRIAKQSFILEGMKVTQGHAIVYLTHHAHRDPSVFQDPDTFQPYRWRTRNREDRDCLYVMGSGPRDCVGKHLVALILNTVCRSLLEQFTWEAKDDVCAKPAYKWLPVTRPKDTLKVTFHRKHEQIPISPSHQHDEQVDEEESTL